LVDVETFSVSQIETGERLEWELSQSFEGLFPQVLVEHEGRLYLFAQTNPIWELDPGRVVTWHSDDGASWEGLGGALGGDAGVMAVSSTSRGLLAVERGNRGEAPRVWTSNDAISWTAHPMPHHSENPHLLTYPQAVFADEERVVVVTAQQFDFETLIEDHLRDTVHDVDITLARGWSSDYTDDGMVITVYGPLGIPALSVPVEDLGITAQEMVEATRAFGGDNHSTTVWTTLDDGEWIETEIEGAQWVDSIVETNRGDLLATGYGMSGEQTWSSIDGISWEGHVGEDNPSRASTWGGRLVAVSDEWPEVLVSEDAVSWEETGLRHLFPAPIEWHVNDLTADNGGIAVSVEGWSQRRGLAPQRPDPPTITRDGVTLTMDFNTGRFEIDTGNETVTWMMYGEPGAGARPEVDLIESTVSFPHPETGEPLITLTFAALERAEQEFWIGSSSNQRFPVIAFSPDGGNWTIQGIEEEFGVEARITDIEMAGDRLIAVVVRGVDYYSPNPRPGYEVWTAIIP
jgi:hypothetical protein